jgi:hypothetical protein
LNSSFAGNAQRLDEAVMAMKGRRFVFCFGDWYGTPLNDIDNDDLFDQEADDPQWTSLGRLSDLYDRRRAGDATAAIILGKLEQYESEGNGRDADDG